MPDAPVPQSAGWLARLKRHAAELKLQTYALYYAYLDPRTPGYARVFALLVAAYAFSPIDLIPDFIPILGYLDDLLIIPAGIWLALKMIPPEVMLACRAKASERQASDPRLGRMAGVMIVIGWAAMVALIGWKIYRRINP